MNKQSFPTRGMPQWTISGNEVGSLADDKFDIENYYSMASGPAVETVAAIDPNIKAPISSVMQENLWSVHAEDTIEEVEELLSAISASSVPVIGYNGAVIGMIGAQELAIFHAEKKNAKAIRAWEISRIKTFEVSPEDTVEDVAQLMVEHDVRNIAVTEQGTLQGVVSMQNLMQVILK